MNDLQIFNNEEFGQIRWVKINNKDYAVGNDIAKALGYSKPNDAITRHCRYTIKHGIPHPQSKNKTLEVNVISESDIYRLIVNSKLPSAERFESWVFDEVLPQIRQTGGYIPIDPFKYATKEEIVAEAHKIVEETLALREEKLKRYAEKLAIAEPKANAYDDFLNSDGSYSFAAASKILSIPKTDTSSVCIGRNTLMAWLRRDNILIASKKEKNMPYQQYINSNYFKVIPVKVEQLEEPIPTVRVTAKGLDWLYKKYKHIDMPEKLSLDSIEEYADENM